MRKLAFIAVLVAVAVVLGLGSTSRRALGATSVLDVVDGIVVVTRCGADLAASERQTIIEGDIVRTGDDGRAVILFFDG